ncbi:DUF1540 domain-containing protein [Clostridium frigidicarnis]|uniref:DUF1540 domain-containing protein n=1 Tax=Clostridium frigidicarnis TaxID=84698 RepID=A0A1I1B3J2_9CLOT|nr:DUF1540 domain-containing protein [Clostridium frigidicarnis]SFB43113.1 protein of unknown function [Clostridium frigidicarnis]
MNSIICGVSNCSHNKSNVCYSNRVNIGGEGSNNSCDTCCGSFLDEKNYGSLTNNTNGDSQCDCLVCKVESCTHNSNCLCALNSIEVAGNGARLYSETNCASFSSK